MSACRHPKRLWRLASDRRYAVCADCGLRVAVVTALPALPTYKCAEKGMPSS